MSKKEDDKDNEALDRLNELLSKESNSFTADLYKQAIQSILYKKMMKDSYDGRIIE